MDESRESKEKRENLIRYKGELEKYLRIYSNDSTKNCIKEKKYNSIIEILKPMYYNFQKAGLFNLESITGDFIDMLQKNKPDEKQIKEYNKNMINGLKSLKKELDALGSAHDVNQLYFLRKSMQEKPF